LLLIDIWLFRTTASDEVESLARLIAENTAAAVSFDDVEAARANLDSVGMRPNVRRACLYDDGGTLFAGVSKASAPPCGPARPTDPDSFVVVGVSAVRWNGREVASVYVERDLSDMGPRVVAFGATMLALVVLGAGVAFVVAHRIHRTISSPIAQLASAARFTPQKTKSASWCARSLRWSAASASQIDGSWRPTRRFRPKSTLGDACRLSGRYCWSGSGRRAA
jgi:hypothetical protein